MAKDKEKSSWADTPTESLQLTLKALLRKYPAEKTPIMKEIYDEIQKRGVKEEKK